jgi:hypothetical protein
MNKTWAISSWISFLTSAGISLSYVKPDNSIFRRYACREQSGND